MQVGYHASHEQYPPGDLLAFAVEADRAGFRAGMCSDHFAPFSLRQGQSGYAWSWLGAALASTKMTFGTVNAPGQRYHPAIVAQKIATLAQMFPGRFWTAFGSGQFINEHVTGIEWPNKATRNQRLLECVTVIRRLLAGETVNYESLVSVSDATLHTLPSTQPLLVAAAISTETAEWAGEWAEGLITVYQPGDALGKVVEAFRRGGGAGKPLFLQAQHVYCDTYEQGLKQATYEWTPSALGNDVIAELRLPEQVDAACETVRPEDIAPRIRISPDPVEHLKWLREYEALGFDTVYVHNVTRNQREYIAMYGREVLPHFAPSPLIAGHGGTNGTA